MTAWRGGLGWPQRGGHETVRFYCSSEIKYQVRQSPLLTLHGGKKWTKKIRAEELPQGSPSHVETSSGEHLFLLESS